MSTETYMTVAKRALYSDPSGTVRDAALVPPSLAECSGEHLAATETLTGGGIGSCGSRGAMSRV
jgi:hypothetical protein